MDPVLVSPSMFRPNIIDMPSAHLLTDSGLVMAEPDTLHTSESLGAGMLPSDISAVRLQLNSLQIMDGLQSGFLNLGQPKGVYLITTVLDGVGEQPVTFSGGVYQGLENGSVVPIGPKRDAPFTVYYREGEMPRILCFSILVARSNRSLRQFGSLITEVIEDKRFSTLKDIIMTGLTAAAPVFGTLFSALTEIVGLFGSHLQLKADEQLGYYEARYTKRFDNLGIGRHPDAGRTIPVGGVRLSYQIDAL